MRAVADAFVAACRLDVLVRKPGNVSRASPGHGMLAAQFIASAQAAAPALSRRGASVGQRIEAAVRASWAAAGCNTNLGIVLLCAPLAAAAERCAAPLAAAASAGAALQALRDALQAVLADMDVADADAAFRAIAHARPAGLGHSAAHDVHAPATTTLRAAMTEAAGRDSIARQYRDGFAELFDTGLAALAGAPPQAASAGPLEIDTAAVQRLYLAWLAGWPDSHIVRKHSAALAQTVIGAAQPWWQRARAGERLDADPAFARWDEDLKRAGVNPGTSADLTVATLMLALLAGAAWHGT